MDVVDLAHRATDILSGPGLAVWRPGAPSDRRWRADSRASTPAGDEPACVALYRVAQAVFSYPTTALVEDLTRGTLLADAQAVAAAYGWSFADRTVGLWLRSRTPSWTHAVLEVEYLRLFVGNDDGVPAPPYASFYRGPHSAPDTTAHLGAAYAAAGFCLPPVHDAHPDHVAAQAAYLRLLAQRGDGARALPTLRALLTWLPQFHRRVVRASVGPLYPAFSEWFLELAYRDAVLLSHAAAREARLAVPQDPGWGSRKHTHDSPDPETCTKLAAGLPFAAG